MGSSSSCAASSPRVSLAEHQVDAAYRALALLRRRHGVLLADEVGLGKSFVAAAVAREMQSERHEIELIVPASLVPQWRETLRVFSVRAKVFTHDGIVSEPFVADPDRRRLVIVDEAHAFRNPKTQRYDALARRSLAARMMLVTATPLCNAAADLHALIALLVADDALRDLGVPSIDLAFERGESDVVVGELMIRRDRSILPAIATLERHVIRHRVPNVPIDALQFPLVGHADLLRRFLRRRLESSEAALLESLRRQVRFYERVLESGRALSKREYRRAFGFEEDRQSFQQILFWDAWAPPESVSFDEIRAELSRLDALRRTSFANEKRELLRGLLDDEPALIFTMSAATARDLHAFLRTGRRCGLATARDGIGAIEQFRAGAIDVLIATDLAAEGLNLQRAGVVIHYDIPWNPVKLDQRNGRAHRLGQERESVKAIYFLPENDDVMRVVAAKNRIRRRVLRGEAVAQCGAGAPAGGMVHHRSAAGSPAPHGETSTLRPRITSDAAITRLKIDYPESLEKKHKAGVERLIAELASEVLDANRITELVRIAAI